MLESARRSVAAPAERLEDASARRALQVVLAVARDLGYAPEADRARVVAATLRIAFEAKHVVLARCNQAAGRPLSSTSRDLVAVAAALAFTNLVPRELLAWESAYDRSSRGPVSPPCAWSSAPRPDGDQQLVAVWRLPRNPLSPSAISALRAATRLAAERLRSAALTSRADPYEEGLASAMRWARVAGLTPRQQQVACLAALGRSNQEIAAELGTSPSTVKDHLAAIYIKTGLPGRDHLAAALLRREST